MSLTNSNPIFDGPIVDNGRRPDIIEDLTGGEYLLGYFDVGGAENTASCLIIKYSVDGAITRRQYAGGSRAFDKVWNSRATYTYTYLK
jgi:hypothetical protein